MGLFSNLKSKVPEILGTKTIIPKLVIGINQVDNLGPWDNAINLPTDKTEKNIETRVKDIIRKLSSGAHSASKEQIEYYSALRAYRLHFLVNKIVHCCKTIVQFQPKFFWDEGCKFGMTEEDQKEIEQMHEQSRKKFAKLNLDVLIQKVIEQLPEDKAAEVINLYSKEKSKPVRVGILGQAGVGKTTTVNNLFNANFKTSRTVVGTDKAQYKDFELKDGSIITIVDLPGYGRSIAEDAKYKDIYIKELKQCDIILLIVQANEKALVDDQYMIECLYEWSKDGLI